MKILITGATGFIGSHLIEALSVTDAEIYALVRDPGRMTFAPAGRIRILKGGLGDVPELPAGLDIVFHLAGLTKALKSEDYYTVNAEGTARLFNALEGRRPHPKVVILSSLAAGGPSGKGGRRKESDPPDPVTPYGKSKRGGEEEALARKEGFPVVILRVGAVYGPRDTDFLSLFRYVEWGLVPVIGSKKPPLSLCYVKDLIRALLLAGEKALPSGEIFNIAQPEPRTFDEFGLAAGSVMGRAPRRLIIPFGLAYSIVLASEFVSTMARRPGPLNRDKYRDYRQAGWVADVTKAREELGFTTDTTLEAGLRETIAWYRENGWLSRSSGSRSAGSKKSRKTSSSS
jgi:nucleoside-diphosphate-sugar epimerase